jgi:hypothetical protein
VQTIDIMPLVADVLKTPLSWEVQGLSPLREDVASREFKTIFHSAATQRLHITPEDLHAGGESVRRKIELLGGEQVEFRTPTIAPRRDLIGRTIELDDVAEETGVRVVVEQSRQYLEVDPNGDLLPAVLHGQVMDEQRRPVSAVLAIAVDGRIQATTKTYDGVPGYQGAWSALIDPRLLRPGRNAIDVLIVREAGLTRAYSTSPPALASINLLADEAQSAWDVELQGFHPMEGDARQRFRWTSGAARIEMKLPGDERPRSVRVGLAPIARQSALRVSYNGCAIFEGTVPGGPWYKTFSLDACPESARAPDSARVEIDTPTFSVPGDPRALGLPLESVRLSAEPWPLAPATTPPRARLRILEPGNASRQTLSPGTPVRVEVANLGSMALPSAAEAETERPVRLVATWRLPSGDEPAAEQAVDLPRVLYPGERLQTWVRLELPPAVRQSRAAEADLSLKLTQAGGAVALAAPGAPRLRVRLR